MILIHCLFPHPIYPKQNTKFYLTGVPTPDRERVSFNLDQTFIDVPSGMRVAVT